MLEDLMHMAMILALLTGGLIVAAFASWLFCRVEDWYELLQRGWDRD